LHLKGWPPFGHESIGHEPLTTLEQWKASRHRSLWLVAIEPCPNGRSPFKGMWKRRKTLDKNRILTCQRVETVEVRLMKNVRSIDNVDKGVKTYKNVK